jgi:hypothetical protein
MHQTADFASQATKEVAERQMGLTLSQLLDMRWDQQPSRDPDRRKLRFEHLYPIGHAVSEIMTMREPTVERVEAVLKKITVCWVTAEEDRKLGRAYRPDPWQAYDNAGIVVLDRAGRLNLPKGCDLQQPDPGLGRL